LGLLPNDLLRHSPGDAVTKDTVTKDAMKPSDTKLSPPHEVVDRLREGSVVATITAREVKGIRRFTFALVKEYDKDGVTHQSHWFDKHHLSDIQRLIDRVEARVETLEDQSRGERRQAVRRNGVG
jgi:hypothetical protein